MVGGGGRWKGVEGGGRVWRGVESSQIYNISEYFYGTLCAYSFPWDYGQFQDNNNRTFKDMIVSRGQGYHQMFILIPYMHSAHQYEQNEVSHNYIDLF